tara:strand:+ start:51 stop:1775 length:1725 start_codon:yes stop_codon:yes gene_type:complete
MNKALIFLLFLTSNSISAQEFLNLGFEYTIQNTEEPEIWYTGNPPYEVSVDTIQNNQSAQSLKIECETYKENAFGFISNVLPFKYAKGKSIELKGKVKTEKVKNGYAGLWLNAQNDDGSNTFDNMNERGLTSSTEWTEVSIKLDIKHSVNNITFGALLTGQGKAWFDNLEIYIDGQLFNDAKQQYSEPTKEEIDWLKQNIQTLKTYEISDNNNDLNFLSKVIGNSKIVALGENTHGSSEIFKMKSRLVKYLQENENFNIFSIEANMPEAYKLNDYIIDGKGNPINLIKGMYFWTWRTQEVLNMVEWMKTNSHSTQNISFTGFDMQYYNSSMQIIEKMFGDNSDTSNLTTKLEEKLKEISERKRNTNSSVISLNDKDIISKLTTALKSRVRDLKISKKEMDWLTQNIRLIEQYVDISNKNRDKYMAENVLWIKSQNPNSKIVVWAHNGHIKETGNSMGKYLADSLKSDYISIGFAFYEGNYTATGDNGLTSYKAQKAEVGSYEYLFNKVDEPIFLLDLRPIKNSETELSKINLKNSLFRNVGALNTINEFYKTDLSNDFDMIIFIKTSSNSKLLD